MALTTSTEYIYPRGYQQGDWIEKNNGPRRYCVQLIGEGTGAEDEADVRKLVLADHVTPLCEAASDKFIIEKIEYEIRGFTGISLEFDRVPQKVFFKMGGDNNGKQDFTRWGGLPDDGDDGTGDILLTTNGGGQYDVYNIILTFRVK